MGSACNWEGRECLGLLFHQVGKTEPGLSQDSCRTALLLGQEVSRSAHPTLLGPRVKGSPVPKNPPGTKGPTTKSRLNQVPRTGCRSCTLQHTPAGPGAAHSAGHVPAPPAGRSLVPPRKAAWGTLRCAQASRPGPRRSPGPAPARRASVERGCHLPRARGERASAAASRAVWGRGRRRSLSEGWGSGRREGAEVPVPAPRGG